MPCIANLAHSLLSSPVQTARLHVAQLRNGESDSGFQTGLLVSAPATDVQQPLLRLCLCTVFLCVCECVCGCICGVQAELRQKASQREQLVLAQRLFGLEAVSYPALAQVQQPLTKRF